ncbi:MAG: hypothetical protein KDF64_02955 [Geminicoccaceae bacterium]|nr:hypothetical protein [Geminicoccaceae bacterium]
MTGKPQSDQDALNRLADALVEDLLETSDQDILAEVREDNDDPSAIAANMRAMFEKTVASAGKARLAAARSAIVQDRQRSAVVISLDPAEARRRLERIVANDPETARKLTLAARKGEGLSDSDVLSMLEDLEELGVQPPPDQTDDNA